MELARLWRSIFSAFDGLEDPSTEVDLAWMPAHTKEQDVGKVALSNGQLLTARDRAANDAADFLAKRGAQTHRVPVWLRKKVKDHELLAEWAARTLAISTFAANNLVDPCKEGLQRDSTGLPAWKRKTSSLAATKAGAQDSEGSLVVLPDAALKAKPRARRAPSESSSCDSSEEVLEDGARSLTARQCKHRRRAESRERTSQLVKSINRVAFPDEGEATAPHRLRHLRDRVLRSTASKSATEQAARAALQTTTSCVESSTPTPSCKPVLANAAEGAELPLRSRPQKLKGGAPGASARLTADSIRSLLS